MKNKVISLVHVPSKKSIAIFVEKQHKNRKKLIPAHSGRDMHLAMLFYLDSLPSNISADDFVMGLREEITTES